MIMYHGEHFHIMNTTSSVDALSGNKDEGTQIKRDERKGDQGRFQE